MSRPKAGDQIKNLGGIVVSSVSKDLDYLVVGNKPGSKYDKAKKMNITILTEKEFLELINNKGV